MEEVVKIHRRAGKLSGEEIHYLQTASKVIVDGCSHKITRLCFQYIQANQQVTTLVVKRCRWSGYSETKPTAINLLKKRGLPPQLRKLTIYSLSHGSYCWDDGRKDFRKFLQTLAVIHPSLRKLTLSRVNLDEKSKDFLRRLRELGHLEIKCNYYLSRIAWD